MWDGARHGSTKKKKHAGSTAAEWKHPAGRGWCPSVQTDALVRYQTHCLKKKNVQQKDFIRRVEKARSGYGLV